MDTRSDTQRQDQERTHTRHNESRTGFQKDTERRLNWYGDVMRRDEEGMHTEGKCWKTDKPVKRKTGRPKIRRKDACQRDMKSTGLRAGEETDRATWSRKIMSHTGDSV